jgi:hypothetical protein
MQTMHLMRWNAMIMMTSYVDEHNELIEGIKAKSFVRGSPHHQDYSLLKQVIFFML